MVCLNGFYFDQMNEIFRSDYKTLEVYLRIFFKAILCSLSCFQTLSPTSGLFLI